MLKRTLAKQGELPFAPRDQAAECRVRFMVHRDMPEVVTIEQDGYGEVWSRSDFSDALRERNCIGIVAVQDLGESRPPKVVGYAVYRLHRARIELDRLVVAVASRRLGVGAALIGKLQRGLTANRPAIEYALHETNRPGLAFLRRLGFRAQGVLRDHYEADGHGGGEDAYEMSWELGLGARTGS